MVLCDSVQGAIVETISQLFSLACDRLMGLMWELRTPLLPATNTPSPQRLRLATESAGGKGVCTAVASEQERKQNSWRRIKSSENGFVQTCFHFLKTHGKKERVHGKKSQKEMMKQLKREASSFPKFISKSLQQMVFLLHSD